ncbi:TPA: hypothetical protein JIZ13_06575 [Acinetobacter nosocomialis]|uniref:hypothetical protein n=1 Tax=Acinetobacter calcoaceticus/baumannii complex TaxID=909768 RepID=UPI000461D738|nr:MULTISPECIES: hypothetical protein [Acinetobacter calcoaceticus/baumannii complex]KCX87035.1 hypothetical protein J568_4125 [Acinetobacter baumannii 6112]KRI64376.1 hypothetical protein APC61_08555 [Acinetobacter baumannii]MBR7725860.1 hypothetical protein [Acinetobacter nosocomialis]MBS5993053.1 hypothetical protein [Acinetobacter baumannii]MCQ9991405.1 hypothetical protein [Acinetobacter baumannii]
MQEDDGFPWWGWVTGAIIVAFYFYLLMPEVSKLSYSFAENVAAPISLATNSSIVDIFLAVILFAIVIGSVIAPFCANYYLVKNLQKEI